jgi:hypothetical protein
MRWPSRCAFWRSTRTTFDGGVALKTVACWQWRAARVRPGSLQRFECDAPPFGRGPLRCSAPWPRRQLTARTAFAPFKQSRRSQFTRRAARAGHGPCASRHRIGAPQPARAHPCGHGSDARGEQSSAHRLWFLAFGSASPHCVARAAGGSPAGRLCDAEKRRNRGCARSALCDLTSSRLFERSARRARSEFATSRDSEHRRGPRPPGRGVAFEALSATRPWPRAHVRRK